MGDVKFIRLQLLLAIAFLPWLANGATTGYLPRVTKAAFSSATTVAPNDVLRLNFTLTSNSEPAASVIFTFSSGNNRRQVSTNSPTAGVCTATVLRDWPNGTYVLSGISIIGADQSFVTYTAAGQADTPYPAWKLPADAPAFDGSALSFTVTHGLDAITPIALTQVTQASAGPYVVGQPLVLNYTAALGNSDGAALFVELLTSEGRVSGNFQFLTSAQGTISISTNAGWKSGTGQILFANIFDNNSSATYARGDSSQVLPTTLDFQLTGGVDNPVVPPLTAISMTTPASRHIGDTITFAVSFGSGTSSIQSVQIYLNGARNSFPGEIGIRPAASTYDAAAGTVSATIDSSWIADVYTVDLVATYDSTGRGLDYTATSLYNGLHASIPPLQISASRIVMITSQPRSATVVAGQSATLAVGVRTPWAATTTYQWYSGASGDTTSPVAGAQSATFTPSPTATTQYWVRVNTNNAMDGSYDSDAATVTVVQSNALPTITGQPSAIDTLAGSTAVLSATVVGSPSTTYRWYKDGGPVSGATDAQLTFLGGSASDSGTYYLRATNSNGAVNSNSVAVVFEATPQISIQPIAQSAYVGDNVTLSVAATGGNLSYEWSKDGSTTIRGAAATNANVSLPAVQTSDAGSYRCKVTNSAGSVQSAAAILTVDPRPTPGMQLPPSIPANLGSVFSYTVNASQSPTAFAATGLPPGLSIDNHGVIAGTPTKAGSFGVTITATNAFGSGTAETNIVVGVTAPTIASAPAAITVTSGEPAQLAVVANGSPPLAYQWNWNGAAIEGATAATLTFNPVKVSSAGSYSVAVSNSAGTATGGPATVTVLPAPVIGVYFGTFANGGGTWALYVRTDRTGVFVAYLTDSHSAITTAVACDADGGFAATPTSSRASSANRLHPFSASPLLSGNIKAGVVSGSLSGGPTLTGAADVGTATTDASGYYTASALGADSGALSIIVGPSGRAFAVSSVGSSSDAVSGTISSDGSFAATSVSGAQDTFSIRRDGSVLFSTTSAGSSKPTTYAGLGDGVVSVSQLANISARARVGTGENVLTVGFAVGGTTSKQVLIRGIGPTLARFDIASAVADPQLTLFDAASVVVAGNEDWGGSTTLTDAFTLTGAFGLPTSSKDAALLRTLSPARYSAELTATSGSGVAMVEAYDADRSSSAEFVNLSVRSLTGPAEDVVTAGFVILGNAPRRVLVRAIGPSLGAFGIAGTIDDPIATVYSGSQVIAQNDNWGGGAALVSAFRDTGAFMIPVTSRDAALVVTLTPGSYTVQASAVNGSRGVVLLELYALPLP